MSDSKGSERARLQLTPYHFTHPSFFCLIKDSHIIIITAAKRDAKQMAWDMKDWKLGTLSNSYVIFWS